jgi:tetratricopeptide (TPR) repeat protein
MSITRYHIAAVTMTLLGAMVPGCTQQQAPRLPVPDEAPVGESDFDKAADRPPTLKTLYVMAKLYASRGKDAEAEAALQRVIAENPTFIPAYCEMAEAQLRQRRTDDAIKTLNSGLKASPRDAILLNDLGMCHLLKNDYANALSAFKLALSVRPDDERYCSNAAVALGMLGRYDEALAAYAAILPPADAHYNLGVICESRRDPERAAIEFRKSIDLQSQQRATSDAALKARTLGALAAAERANEIRRQQAASAAAAKALDAAAAPAKPAEIP